MNIIRTITPKKNILLLLAILFAAACLRFYHLSYQSFWLDELHTVIESDSRKSFKDFFDYLFYNDQFPPLFYLCEKLLFHLFGGSNEFIARSLSAVSGVLGVWAIYALGKSLYSTRIGLVAAALLCFNVNHIYYSQDARPYTLMLLFTCLSFLFLVRLIQSPSQKTLTGYVLFTLLLLYTHYLSIFVVAAQVAISGLMLCFVVQPEYKKRATLFLLSSFIVIGIGFSFRLPHLLLLTKIKGSWIQTPSDHFLNDLFFGFFDHSGLLIPFVMLLSIFGLIYLLNQRQSAGENKAAYAPSNTFLFILLFFWVFITFLVPYARSLWQVPFMVERYFITLLPAFLLVIAFGVEYLPNNAIRYAVLGTFCVLSTIQLTGIRKHYTIVSKTQFRELAQFVSKHPEYPLNAERTAWHQHYYLEKNIYTNTITNMPLNSYVEQVRSKAGPATGFWLADAHGAEKPAAQIRSVLEEKYKMKAWINLHDAWAILYVPYGDEKTYETTFNFDSKNYSEDLVAQCMGEATIPVWGNDVPFKQKIGLPAGEYVVEIVACGTAADKVYPHVNIGLEGGQKIGNFFVAQGFDTYTFPLNINSDSLHATICVSMDNDLANSSEDRNIFIKHVRISRKHIPTSKGTGNQ